MNDFWTTYLFPFLTVVGMIILYFTVNNLLPSYFNEKGKNLATKDDIEKITQLVESVKYAFAKETEKLKANLSLLTNVQVGLVSEERNAIIEYNQKYFSWMHMLIDTSLNNANDTNNDELEAYKRKIGEAYSEFLNSETKLNLFVENRDLIGAADKLKIETLQHLSGLSIKALINLQFVNHSVDLTNKHTPLEQRGPELKDLLQKKGDAYREFRETMLIGLKEIVGLQHQFQKLCRTHIYQLIKSQELDTK
jgi:hypothetical protein